MYHTWRHNKAGLIVKSRRKAVDRNVWPSTSTSLLWDSVNEPLSSLTARVGFETRSCLKHFDIRHSDHYESPFC